MARPLRSLSASASSIFVMSLVVVTALVGGLVVATESLAARPNVVLIMSDDQGLGDFGATGNPLIETPHIDAMARRSASMSTFYVSPVCAPTRACLMTGRYNYRTRAIDTFVGRAMMEPAEVTIAEVLADAGYATGIFGKWHLGDNYPLRPMDQGFSASLVHRGGGLGQPSDPPENDRRYTDAILFRDGVATATKGYCTDVYFDAAFDFIEESQRDDKNFFIYLPTNAPHGPFHDVPEALRQKYLAKPLEELMIHKPSGAKLAHEHDTLARIAAMITNIDENVGRLFDKLDELELTENTIVIYMVDNGPNTVRYVTRQLRGRKSDVHEGGIRSPFWMHWPARLTAGHVDDTPAAHIDVLPTLLAACEVPVPAGLKLDGRNFLPLLKGESIDWPEREIVIQSHRGNVPVRYHHFMIRDARWKLVHPTGFGYTGFKKPPTFEKLELYDIVADPGETRNLAAEHPEVVTRLKAAYNRWFDDVSSTREDNYGPPRIHIGTPHENPTALTRQDWRDGNWDVHSNGYWLLHVATAGTYDFEVILRPAAAAVGTASLEVAGRTVDVAVEPAAERVSIDGVELPAGDGRLKVTLRFANGERGPYQVLVRRRATGSRPARN
ncbi:MAG: arylsulfatase [Planctomycetota bacterium]|nr:MAG: arylsulfatase [Planctomycetota bacterium]REK45850.1 MAG: arylsulfatase [Planctomycetota bacterium]